MVGDTAGGQTEKLRCDISRTLGFEYLLLRCILVIYATELEAVLLSHILGIRDLDDGGPVIGAIVA